MNKCIHNAYPQSGPITILGIPFSSYKNVCKFPFLYLIFCLGLLFFTKGLLITFELLNCFLSSVKSSILSLFSTYSVEEVFSLLSKNEYPDFLSDELFVLTSTNSVSWTSLLLLFNIRNGEEKERMIYHNFDYLKSYIFFRLK